MTFTELREKVQHGLRKKNKIKSKDVRKYLNESLAEWNRDQLVEALAKAIAKEILERRLG